MRRLTDPYKGMQENDIPQITELANLLFAPQDIAVILGIDDIEGFRMACGKIGTTEYQAYNAGRLQQEVILRRSILTLAKQGSSPAQTLAKKMLDESAAKIYDR